MANENGEDTTVRLIGIDTPESVNPDESQNNEFGEMASEYTKTLLKDIDKVYLQYDEQLQDIYGRTLAYVWTCEDVNPEDSNDIEAYMLNAILVKEGYAYNKDYKPNSHYAQVFYKLRENAQTQNYGLWQYEDFSKLWLE